LAGAYSAPQDPLAGFKRFKGPTSKGGRGKEGREGKEREGEGKRREGKGERRREGPP